MSSILEFLAPDRKMLIGGAWRDAAGGGVLEVRNPANGARLTTIPAGDAADIDLAVEAARGAFEGGWASTLPAERQKILLRLADLLEENGEEISWLDTLDMGAPLWRTRGSIELMAGIIRYNSGLALTIHGKTIAPSRPDTFTATVKEPIGVCGAIIPWNSPGWSAVLNTAPALAAGCTMILKPAEDGSLAPLFFGKLCQEAGLPDGVVNVVTGLGASAGAALAAHPGVDKIAFTGSTATGQGIARAAAGNLKKVSLELGGKSPNIVFADADLDKAAATAVIAAFGNTGQVCSAGSRLFVHRSVAEAFVAEVTRRAGEMRVGSGAQDGTQLGPLASERQMERVLAYIEGARTQGATIACGGARLTSPPYESGYFVPPTILTDLTDDMTVVREEVFGPVLCILPFDDVDEVIRRANATPYGLGAGVWTKDIGLAHRVAARLHAGSIWINCYNALDPAVPAGGYKQSGIGREYGTEQLGAFLQTKSLWIATS